MRLLWQENCILGESPLWHPTEKALYWVDIVKKTLHRLEIESQTHQSFLFDTEVCCVVPHDPQGLVIALRDSIIFFNPHTNEKKQLATLDEKNTMFNDGHCDSTGRLWIGTKDVLEKNPFGKIYSFSEELLKTQDHYFTVSNGIVFSLDKKYCYIADSPQQIIYRYHFDRKKGKITNKEVFTLLDPTAGYPDGMTIDAEGYLWNCHFKGWRITRYSPEGKINRVIEMPVESPTSCCFGGHDLKTLFVTSASRDVEDLSQQKEAGCVFAIHTDIQGVPENFFKIGSHT